MSDLQTASTSFWDTCPGCGSADTAQTSSGYYHTDRHCNVCGKGWRTSWEGNDDEDDFWDDDEHEKALWNDWIERCPKCGGDGEIRYFVPCPLCKGKGYIST